MTWWIVLIAILFFCSALFSAAETALFSLSSLKIKAYKQEKNLKKQLVAQLIASPQDLLVTIIMLNIAINIIIQNAFSSLFGERATWIYNVGVPFFLTLVIGEIIPKSVGLVNNEPIALRVSPLISFLQRLLLPFRRMIIYLTNFVFRVLFFFLRHEKRISIDELRHALRASHDYGILHEDEAELIRGYLVLQESTVKERMRHCKEVLFFNINEPLSHLIHLFVDRECSRIPVCDHDLDHIIGVMSSRLFFLHRESIHHSEDIRVLLEKPFFVPETIPAITLLRQFYRRQESFAIVIDEYSSVAGIIALEDLVETVVGEIVDLRDQEALYILSGKDAIIASGKMELSEFKKVFDISLVSENNMVTIGGYLTEKMGDIPKNGNKYRDENFLFHVLAADPTRVRRVYIRRLERPK